MASNTSVDDTPERGSSGAPAPGRGEPTRPNAVTRPPTTAQEHTEDAPRRVLGYRRQRFEARKVRRLVRHVDPWSVLKLSLLLALCLWVVVMIAAVIVWSVANSTGALASFERFFNENLQLEDFTLTGDVLFRQFGLVSLLGALGLAAATVVATLVFNLISDIIGGVWISVIEEETSRPVSRDDAEAAPRSPRG
jgi:hypothetical protein